MSQVKNGEFFLNTKHRLITVAVASACAALVAPAFAQEAAAPAPTTDISGPSGVATSTVVVTGIRASMQSTLNLKRNSDGIVDGIVADDIGKFPDTNLAEAVQRISGVSIDRSNGEGQKVTVRGVGPDLNLILLNGRQMPSTDPYDRGTRSFDFANLASEAVSQLQVYKSSRADTPAGGLGATINIMTGRPLDLGNQTSIGGKVVYDRSNVNLPEQISGGKFTPEVSALISRRFGANDMFGVSLTASFQKRNSGYAQATVTNGWHGPWDYNDYSSYGTIKAGTATNAPTSGFYLTPKNFSYYLQGVERERTNGQLTFQFRPIKDWTTTLDYTYARNKIHQRANELNVWYNFIDQQRSNWVKEGAVSSPTFYEEGSVMQDLSMNAHDYGTVTTLKSTGFNTQYRVNSGLKLSFDAHHSVSQTGALGPWGTNNDLATASYGRNTNGIIFGSEMPVFYGDYTPGPFQASGDWFQNARAKQTIDQFQASGSQKIGESSTLNFGLSATKTRHDSAFQDNQNAATWAGTAPGAQADAGKYYDQSNWTKIDYRQYFSSLGGSDNPKLFPNMWMVNFANVRDQAIKVTGHPEWYVPRLDAPTEVYNLEEKSNALYGQFNTDWDTALPMHTGIGLRYEKTKLSSSADIQPITSVDWVSQNEYRVNKAASTNLTEAHDYHYFLPSLDWDMDVLSNLKVRASYGVNIGRARWNLLQAGMAPNGNPDANGEKINAGAPGLKPVKSQNFDLSTEWYYSKQSMVSLGLYYKKLSGYAGSSVTKSTLAGVYTPIGGKYYQAALASGISASDTNSMRDYIFTHFAGQPGVLPSGEMTGDGHYKGIIRGVAGDPLLPTITTSTSNVNNSSLKGAEINWQHMFDNGFGFQANYTYVDTGLKYDNNNPKDQFAMVGFSNSANLVGIYENKDWSVRLAYNWRGQFLSTTADNGDQNPSYTEPYGQVDLSVGYNVTKNLAVSLEGINLTGASLRTHGRSDLQVLRVTTGGARYMLGARYKF